MTYDQLLAHYKRPSDAARALGVDRRVVDNWKKRRIPSVAQLKIERLTGLHADEQARQEARDVAALLDPATQVVA